MNKRNTKNVYFLGVAFLLTGFLFLASGLWNITGALAADFFVSSAVVTLIFLLLFATVAMTYGLFLFKSAKKDAGIGNGVSIIDRVSPAKVVSLLAFGLAPLLFVYLSTESRELNNRRQAAFQILRPAFLQYVSNHGKVTRDLPLLVPDYLAVLPGALILDDKTGTDKWVLYQPGNNTALFCYKTGGIPAAETCYDIINNQYFPSR